MRITQETLLKIANDTVARQAKTDRDLLGAFLHGSLLKSESLLGGTTDIDLFFVYNSDIAEQREIIRLTEEVHLDIARQPRKMYRQARELRLHPWLGPTLYGCRILYDPQHFLDFTQASVRGQFEQPENVLVRSRVQLESARQTWMEFQMNPAVPGFDEIDRFLKAVEQVGNAIAGMSGPPLAVRRFLLEFPGRAQAAGQPGLYNGLLGLLGGSEIDGKGLQAWLEPWSASLRSLGADQAPAQLNPTRLPYYQRAIEAMLASEHPLNALWPFLYTWTAAARNLPDTAPGYADWQNALQQLGFSGDHFEQRVTALDAFLDTVEDLLETWAQKQGVG